VTIRSEALWQAETIEEAVPVLPISFQSAKTNPPSGQT